MSIKLKKLLEGVDNLKISGSADIEITGICVDSRRVKPGHLFVAVKGNQADGHDFIKEAVERGVSAVITQKEIELPKGIAHLMVEDSGKVLSQISNVFYDFPSKKIKVIGVTGTNGKSTIAYVIQHILIASGKKAGRLGTLGYQIGQRLLPARETTPGPPHLQEYLAEMVREGAEYAAIEVSSHGLDQDRVRDIDFAEAVFTDISLDHLDYHLSMGRYVEVKYKFFKDIISHLTTSVINADSAHCPLLSDISPGRVLTYGLKNKADLKAESIILGPQATEFDLIVSKTGAKYHLKTDLVGKFNVSNLLAAISVTLDLGLNLNDIIAALVNIGPIPGRLERIECGQPFTVLVDFAHTPDAIEAVLNELRQISRGRLIIVFGCGGDRDRSKRPLMGNLATRLADKTIITTDNPRSEDPHSIAQQITKGVSEGADYEVILDRREAIKRAFDLAQPADSVVLAGKGHEAYQVLKDTVVPFDDRQVARELLKAHI